MNLNKLRTNSRCERPPAARKTRGSPPVSGGEWPVESAWLYSPPDTGGEPPPNGEPDRAKPQEKAARGSVRRLFVLSVLVVLLPLLSLQAQNIELTRVVSKSISRTIELPGEFQPYLNVTLHSRVTGFVDKVLVDRGSAV